MKKFLLIVLLKLFISFTVAGQSFISAEKQWNVRLTFFGNYSMEIFKIQGDTTINNQTYNKLLVSYDSLATWKYMGSIREDDKKVYYVMPAGDEGLLYDFGLKIGDTTYISNYFCHDDTVPIYVENIDTILFNGFSYKRWHLKSVDQPFVTEIEDFWLEGVGSVTGLIYSFFNYCIVCPDWKLICYYYDDTLLYQNPIALSCYEEHTGIDEPDNELKLVLSPNPVIKGDPVIVNSSVALEYVAVISIDGAILKKLNSPIGDIVTFDTSDLKPGLYIITVITNDHRSVTKKIIVI